MAEVDQDFGFFFVGSASKHVSWGGRYREPAYRGQC